MATHDDRWWRGRFGAWLGFAAIALVAGVLHHLGLVTLVAWTPLPFDDDLVPWVLAALVAGHGAISLTPTRHRTLALLVVSLGAWLIVCPQFVVLGAAWAVAYRALLWSRLRPALTVLFPIATLIGVVALADAAHAPSRVAAYPWLWVMAYSFALGWFLRALVVWHEARIGGARPTVVDVLTYFFLAPFALIPPYMLALPKLALVRDGVRAPDPAVQRSGVRWIGYGLAVQVTLALAAAGGVDPRLLLIDALRVGAWPQVVPLLVVVYPIRAVFESCGAGALVLGLVRCFGVPMAPAFDRPLLARGIADWWRRYNLHFRQLLIDLFWTPTAMRLRRHPIAASYVGCAVVFLVGSAPLHWPKQAALHGSPWTFPWSTLTESVVMTALVGTALVLERRRGRRRAAPGLARRWAQRAGTWALVCAAILGVGYQVDYRVRLAPFERAQARALAVRTPEEAAALLPDLESALDERPLDPVRRATLARVLAAAGRPDAALRQLAIAAAFVTHPTIADARLVKRAGVLDPLTARRIFP
ncbi:MAG: hypothetical protein IPL61_30685 [Myxococcales bacterium]|nr:hypothetical protein [Myxococcales bacterium]